MAVQSLRPLHSVLPVPTDPSRALPACAVQAGVLVHILDGNEDASSEEEGLPWRLCQHMECSRGNVDAWSASLISRTVRMPAATSSHSHGLSLPHSHSLVSQTVRVPAAPSSYSHGLTSQLPLPPLPHSQVPTLFTDSAGIAGFVLAPSVEIYCAFPSDVGTLGSAQVIGHEIGRPSFESIGLCSSAHLLFLALLR